MCTGLKLWRGLALWGAVDAPKELEIENLTREIVDQNAVRCPDESMLR